MKRTNYTTEEFKKSCKSNSTICFIGAIVLAMIAICGLFTPIYCLMQDRGNIADVIGGLEILTIALGFNFASKIFRSMSIVGSPFSYDIADKIMGLSQILEIGSALCFAAAIVIRVTGHGDLIDSSASVDPGIFFLFTWAIASFFSALAKAFDHGAKLQQEADETL
ncbi:MAG: hypothetical protein KBA55_08120 [Ruminococcus sp.]|nr:hypothetical protein [Ruminococcus sp.]